MEGDTQHKPMHTYSKVSSLAFNRPYAQKMYRVAVFDIMGRKCLCLFVMLLFNTKMNIYTIYLSTEKTEDYGGSCIVCISYGITRGCRGTDHTGSVPYVPYVCTICTTLGCDHTLGGRVRQHYWPKL